MDVKDELQTETKTWMDRFDDRVDDITPQTDAGETMLNNARAYRADTEHFIDDGDWVRAFEAIIWAWSWLEIGEELGTIKER